MRSLGRDDTFFALLEQQAEVAQRAAVQFQQLFSDFENAPKHAEEIEAIEHEGDDLTHRLANKADSTFVTPLDKEDLHKLSGGLDDITDYIEAATGRIALYRLPSARPDVLPLVGLLVQITSAVGDAVKLLRNRRERATAMKTLIRIHEIENESDKRFRAALAELFNAPGADALMVIKWKEIYDRIETAIDKCEEVANAIESVTVKYA